MKIPPRIRITGRISYEVLWSDLIKNDPTCMGYCDDKKRQIILKNGMSEALTISTLLHEVIHCCEFEYKTKIPHKITETLEKGLIRVLKLNGLL